MSDITLVLSSKDPGSLARTFCPNKRQTPREPIHEIRKPIWMGVAIILPDGDVLICVFEDRTPIVVGVQVIRG